MQGDAYQWVAVLNHFDAFFEENIKGRADLQLKWDAAGEDDPPFPTDNCLQILRVTSLLLENCSNKHIYSSSEVGG
jgi:E3 ubiquitin-protein ligase HUWE1